MGNMRDELDKIGLDHVQDIVIAISNFLQDRAPQAHPRSEERFAEIAEFAARVALGRYQPPEGACLSIGANGILEIRQMPLEDIWADLEENPNKPPNVLDVTYQEHLPAGISDLGELPQILNQMIWESTGGKWPRKPRMNKVTYYRVTRETGPNYEDVIATAVTNFLGKHTSDEEYRLYLKSSEFRDSLLNFLELVFDGADNKRFCVNLSSTVDGEIIELRSVKIERIRHSCILIEEERGDHPLAIRVITRNTDSDGWPTPQEGDLTKELNLALWHATERQWPPAIHERQ